MDENLGPYEIRDVEWGQSKDILNRCERNGEAVVFVVPVPSPISNGSVMIVTRRRPGDY